jgi:hypothetical protein
MSVTTRNTCCLDMFRFLLSTLFTWNLLLQCTDQNSQVRLTSGASGAGLERSDLYNGYTNMNRPSEIRRWRFLNSSLNVSFCIASFQNRIHHAKFSFVSQCERLSINIIYFLLFLVGWDWVHLVLRPLWLIVPDDRWRWLWNSWWNEDWQWKPKYSESTRASATFSTTNPTWNDPGSNPGRCGGKPATNRLSYGAALSSVSKREAEALSVNCLTL